MINGPILVVDDDPYIHEAIATALTLYGYQTRIAENGREALTAIEAERPALVLLDLRMPILDGEEVLRELAARKLRLPIVLMSADDEGADVARKHGIGAYLKKPIPLERLLSAVAACGIPDTGHGQHRGAA